MSRPKAVHRPGMRLSVNKPLLLKNDILHILYILYMELRSIFQSIIALHQEEMPLPLQERSLQLPLGAGRIVTVTGIRRCGKSSLLQLTINRLLQRGVGKDQILYVEFDDERLATMGVEDFDQILQAYREMYPQRPLKEVYMFFDEIQLVKGWELFVLRVFKNYCQNIYITGSTAQMLSGEMSSALRGWPDEYVEHPLSFREYVSFRQLDANRFSEAGAAQLAHAWLSYCREGGFPQAVLAREQSERTKLLQSYFNTMLFCDLMEHYQITAAPSTLRYFLKRVMNNLTKPTSINNIYNDLKSQGIKVSKDSLYLWLDYACNVFLLQRVPKYSKSLVKQNNSLNKYYVADFALLKSVLMPQSDERGKALENMVYCTLSARLGNDGQIFYFNESVECDFVVVEQEEVKELVQVCWELDEENIGRETAGLKAAAAFTHCTRARIITCNQERTLTKEGLNIEVLPAWKWMWD